MGSKRNNYNLRHISLFMDEVQFFIVAYHGALGRFVAECVQLGQVNEGRSIDDVIEGCITCSETMLYCAAGGEYEVLATLSDSELGRKRDLPSSPFFPSDERIWKLINPSEMRPFRKEERLINGGYKAVFLCFDRMDAENPHDIG